MQTYTHRERTSGNNYAEEVLDLLPKSEPKCKPLHTGPPLAYPKSAHTARTSVIRSWRMEAIRKLLEKVWAPPVCASEAQKKSAPP